MRAPLKLYGTILLLLVTGVLHLRVLAQSHAFELGTHTGRMLDIFPNFPSHTRHNMLSLSWSTRHYSYWYKAWHEPETGITLTYHDLGNPSVLGYGIGLQYQMLLKRRFRPRWRYFGRARLGGIYNTKHYDYIDNPANIVTGSRFSFLVSLGGGLEFKPSTRSRIILEGSMWHSSNGHTNLPNVGMNTPMLSLAYRYYLKEEVYMNVPKPVDSCQVRPWYPVMNIAIGTNENGSTTRPTNGEKYQKYLVGFGFQKRYKPAFRLSLTLEAYYDEAYRFFVESEELSPDRNAFLQSSAVMILLGHEFIYNHFSIIFQGGINVYNPTLDYLIRNDRDPSTISLVKRYVPGRFAVRYYLKNLWQFMGSPFAQLGVKSNLGQADYLEFGLGFTL